MGFDELFGLKRICSHIGNPVTRNGWDYLRSSPNTVMCT
jgi:hypothetical protein